MSSIVLLRITTARTFTLKHAPRSLIVPKLAPPSLILNSARGFSSALVFRKDDDDRRRASFEGKDNDDKRREVKKGESLANAEPVPWHYEDVSTPPVNRKKKRGVEEKGKLLSTPSRLFKLILPLRRANGSKDSGKAEPLALLVHPRQPLSYLERLIQSELPPIQPGNGAPVRPPEIAFKAVNVGDTFMSERDSEGNLSKAERVLRGGEGEGGVETGGGLGKLSTEPKSGEGGMVRWSTSTELGDFVRDAARGREFIIEAEGNEDVAVGVPSFNQRTYYQRQKLREITKQISDYGKLKSECDNLAHRGAQRVALGGFAGMMSWWGGVCWLTFGTGLGWDVMEPVTYLVGLLTVMAGYLWFLYHNREVSYRSVLHMTISKRQMKLYSQRGFDIERWEELVSDGQALRREIKNIAEQYDVKWDERNDEVGGEKVLKVLKEGDDKSKKKGTGVSDDGDDDELEEDVVEIQDDKKKSL